MKNQKGFSLIELLIVVVIIGIIAAIAIPNLLASRRAANEASAVSSTRVIGSSQATYFATSGNNQTYGSAQQLCDSGLIDGVLGASQNPGPTTTSAAGGSCVAPATAGPKSGYNLLITPIAPASPQPAHFVTALNPAVTSGITQTGMRRFCMVEDGVLRADGTAGATLGNAPNTVAGCTAAPFTPTN